MMGHDDQIRLLRPGELEDLHIGDALPDLYIVVVEVLHLGDVVIIDLAFGLVDLLLDFLLVDFLARVH